MIRGLAVAAGLAVLGTADGTLAADACGEAAAATPAPPAPGGELRVTYFGVSTLMFSDGHDRLLIDGFFSRPGPPQFPLLPIGPDRRRIEAALGKDRTPVRVILTAHAHHDHALDTAAVALALPERPAVVGTPSAVRLVEARGVPADEACVPQGGQPMAFGPYVVTAYNVPHGPAPFLLRWLLDRPLGRTLSGPAWFWSYKDNRNLSYLIAYGGRRILVHPSSGLPAQLVDADTVFLGVGRLGNMTEADAQDYWRATVGPRATAVVPIHWDAFTTPVGQPLRKSPKRLDDVDAGFDRVCRYAAARPELEVWRADSLGVLKIPAQGPVRPEAGVTAFCENGRPRPH
jgi:L-ascorbate metabolism protein UlaG (beta-lactamase superfamily)